MIALLLGILFLLQVTTEVKLSGLQEKNSNKHHSFSNSNWVDSFTFFDDPENKIEDYSDPSAVPFCHSNASSYFTSYLTRLNAKNRSVLRACLSPLLLDLPPPVRG